VTPTPDAPAHAFEVTLDRIEDGSVAGMPLVGDPRHITTVGLLSLFPAHAIRLHQLPEGRPIELMTISLVGRKPDNRPSGDMHGPDPDVVDLHIEDHVGMPKIASGNGDINGMRWHSITPMEANPCFC
jgi:hypothetical protein